MSKPAFSYEQQLDLLKSRGLEVTDEPFAYHCLKHHNYYRLSAYRYPFTERGNPDRFLNGVTFKQIWELYCFDRELRQMVIEGCKRVEISVRSRWAYEVGKQLGPQSYENKKYFTNFSRHHQSLVKLDEEILRSREDFIAHYKRNYPDKRPEVWVAVEVASFGTVSNFLKHTNPPRIRQDIADTYELDEKVFCSLFHHLSVLRNTAAHHSRIWNRRFVVTFKLPRKKPTYLYPNFHDNPKGENGNKRKIYNTLVLLNHLMRIIEPSGDWSNRLVILLGKLPSNLLPDMGFPTDWKTRPMWCSHL
jgi:abortive infection bacteriophage resistance protein